MVRGRCLCGAHRFELEGELTAMHHCHCGYCRKSNGTPYATLVGVDRDKLRWEKGPLISYESSPGMHRESCATCGTPMPQFIEGLPAFVMNGCLTDPIEARAEFHIYVASKADWDEILDDIPAFDALPPGMDPPDVPSKQPLDPPNGTRGSCLCGTVRFVIDGPALTARFCHCSRCRQARGAAFASNIVFKHDQVRFTAGEDQVRSYKVPEAKHFTQCFCGRCGAKLPMVNAERGIAVVPMGSLDDPPPTLPVEHIWTEDVPEWDAILDDLPRHPGAPPA